MKKLLFLLPLFTIQIVSAQGIHSGVVGDVVLTVCPVIPPGGCPLRPYQATVSVFNENGRLVERITTDSDGLFSVNLQPGVYRLVPDGPPPPHKWPSAHPVDVRVPRKGFSQVSIVYAAGL